MELVCALPFWTGMVIFTMFRVKEQLRHEQSVTKRIVYLGHVFSAPPKWLDIVRLFC